MNFIFLLQWVLYKIQLDLIFQFKKHLRKQVISLYLLHTITYRIRKTTVSPMHVLLTVFPFLLTYHYTINVFACN